MKRNVQLASSLLLVVVVTIIHSSQGQEEQGGLAVDDHWVWGQRSASARLPHAVGAVGAAAIVPPPYGRGRSLGIADGLQRRLGRVLDGDTQDRTEFKSITARSYPPVPQPNALGITQEAKRFIKPSSAQKLLDSHAQLNAFPEQNFQPTEFEGRIDGHDSGDPSSQPTLITGGEFPYPFGSKPIDLGDGTSIGWVPQDTLFIRNNPNSGSNAHSAANQFNLPSIADDQDARYTTLDKLFDARTPTKLPDPHSLSPDVLGGLHPDEVYYADKDLVIIKGGGFTSSSPFEKPSDFDEIEKESENNSIKSSLHGNELGEANNIRLVNVRPDEQFSKVPLPYRFVNGNIPTIVHPNSRQAQFNRQQRTAPSVTSDHGFRPVHQTSFTPIAPQARRPYSFIPLQSQQLRTYSAVPAEIANVHGVDGRYQRLDEEEIMEAEPSAISVQRILPPVKRSADSTVVSYHYQSRGSGANAHPIVDYKIHREDSAGSASNAHPALARVQTFQPNSIPQPQKGNPEGASKQHQRPSAGQPDSHTFDNLEDLSFPVGSNALIPQFQTPKERPSFQQAPQGSGPLQGSPTSFTGSPFVPSVFQTQPSHQFSPVDPTSFVAPKPGANQPPISLEGDTRVNFLPPLPPIHSQAEFLGNRRHQQQQPQGVPVSQGGGGGNQQQGGNPNIVRGVRLDNRQQGQGRQPPQRTGVTRRAAGNRFMEPRRRVPFRPRQGPPRV